MLILPTDPMTAVSSMSMRCFGNRNVLAVFFAKLSVGGITASGSKPDIARTTELKISNVWRCFAHVLIHCALRLSRQQIIRFC